MKRILVPVVLVVGLSACAGGGTNARSIGNVRGAVAAAAAGAVIAGSLVQAGLQKGEAKTAEAKLPGWPPAPIVPKIQGPEQAAPDAPPPKPERCTPPAPPPFKGCVSLVAEPHLETPTCLYFCVDHCAYHPPLSK